MGLTVLTEPLALRFGSRFLSLEILALLILALSALLPIVGEQFTVDFPLPDRLLLPGTYRYWGLFLAFAFSAAATQLYKSFVRLRFQGVGFENIERIENSTGFCWILLAALVVWIALRTQPVRVLAITAALAAAASAASLIPAIDANVSVALAGIFIPLLSATLLIGLPVLLARARGGSQPSAGRLRRCLAVWKPVCRGSDRADRVNCPQVRAALPEFGDNDSAATGFHFASAHSAETVLGGVAEEGALVWVSEPRPCYGGSAFLLCAVLRCVLVLPGSRRRGIRQTVAAASAAQSSSVAYGDSGVERCAVPHHDVDTGGAPQ